MWRGVSEGLQNVTRAQLQKCNGYAITRPFASEGCSGKKVNELLRDSRECPLGVRGAFQSK